MKLFNKIAYRYLFQLLFLFSLASADAVFSEESSTGFGEKKMFFEARYGLVYGLPSSLSGSLPDRLEDKNRLKIPAFAAADDLFLYSFAGSDSNRPYLHSSARSFLFEYGLSANWGIGFTLHNQLYKADNLSTSNYAQNMLYSAALYGSDITNTQVLAALNKRYVGLKENANVMNIGTFDLNAAYHFSPGKVWDTYVRFGLGRGNDFFSSSAVTRYTAGAGSRYFVTEHFYLIGELQLAHNEIYKSKGNVLSKFAPNGTLNEAYIQIGAGITPWEIWSRKQADPVPPAKEEKAEEETKKEEEIPPPPEKKPETETSKELKKTIRDSGLKLDRRDGKLVISLVGEGFKSGSEKMNPKSEKAIKNLAKILQKIENVRFTVEGHTDNVPMNKGAKYPDNEKLSLARANTVKEIFLKEKVKKENIDTAGMGDTQPIESNETPEGRQANRRIEIIADKDLSEIPELEGLLEDE